MSHSITGKERLKPGPKPGSKTADRRLRREIANKSAILTALSEISSIVGAVSSTAASNPVVGTVLGIAIIDILHRLRAVSDGAWLAGLALIGAIDLAGAAQAVGQAIGSAAAGVGAIIPEGLVPFTSSSKSINIGSTENLIATSPNVSFETKNAKPALPTVPTKGYLPEQ